MAMATCHIVLETRKPSEGMAPLRAFRQACCRPPQHGDPISGQLRWISLFPSCLYRCPWQYQDLTIVNPHMTHIQFPG